MTDFEQLNGVLKAEEVMIAYFACDEHIGTCCNCLWNEESPRTSTKRNGLNLFAFPRIVAHATHVEALLDVCDEILTLHRCLKLPYYTCPCYFSIYHFSLEWTKWFHILQTNFLRHTIAHATRGIVEVRVSRINPNASLNCLNDATLHEVCSGDLFGCMEKQRMMTHDEVATTLGSLFDDFFSDVKTQ